MKNFQFWNSLQFSDAMNGYHFGKVENKIGIYLTEYQLAQLLKIKSVDSEEWSPWFQNISSYSISTAAFSTIHASNRLPL